MANESEEMANESKEIHQVLHMSGGEGEESYANNSTIQGEFLSRIVPALVQALQDLCDTNLPECVNIADLGCSSGPNTFAAVNRIISIIYSRCSVLQGRTPPEFCVFLNDLPGNDFNTVFKFLPAFQERMRAEFGEDFGPCCVSGVPGSFHGRLFPSNSLHFVHSASSLHWLSQVPPELSDRSNPVINKGNIWISKSSPPAVACAYRAQFQRDFSSFLEARSKEVVPGGRMVLMFRGRRVEDPATDESCLLSDYLGQALQDLVSQGLIAEEKLDSYNLPYYEPYREEIKAEMDKEGSFDLDSLSTILLPGDSVNGGAKCDRATMSKIIGKAFRAIHESMFQSHFGAEIIDPLFQRFTEIMAADTKGVDFVIIVVSVTKKAYK